MINQSIVCCSLAQLADGTPGKIALSCWAMLRKIEMALFRATLRATTTTKKEMRCKLPRYPVTPHNSSATCNKLLKKLPSVTGPNPRLQWDDPRWARANLSAVQQPPFEKPRRHQAQHAGSKQFPTYEECASELLLAEEILKAKRSHREAGETVRQGAAGEYPQEVRPADPS